MGRPPLDEESISDESNDSACPLLLVASLLLLVRHLLLVAMHLLLVRSNDLRSPQNSEALVTLVNRP